MAGSTLGAKLADALERYLDDEGPCYFEPNKALELAGVEKPKRKEAVTRMLTHPKAIERIEAVLLEKGLSLHRTAARILQISRTGDTDATRLSALRLMLKEDLFLVSSDVGAELWRRRKAEFKARLAKAAKEAGDAPPPYCQAPAEEPGDTPAGEAEVAERLESEAEGAPDKLFPVPDGPELGVTKPTIAAEF